MLTALAEIQNDTVVVSHFIAINAVVGHATADDRVVSFAPDNGSCTIVDVSGDRFAVVTLGAQRATRVM
jgi:broad specificity phosphatase PhoE